MYKVGVIGDHDSIIGFKALGMTIGPADTGPQALVYLRQWEAEHYAVIFITEPLAAANQTLLTSLRNRKLPAIIPIPAQHGSTGLGMSQVRESLRKAVGLDLFADSPETGKENQP